MSVLSINEKCFNGGQLCVQNLGAKREDSRSNPASYFCCNTHVGTAECSSSALNWIS